MNSTISFSEQIPVCGSYDVVVAGGGIAGVSAALAAARNGCSALLLEKQSWLGGLATTGLVNYWVPLCNGRGKLIIRGMAEELLHLSIAHGFDTLPREWKGGKEPDHPTLARCQGHYSSGIFALEMLKLLKAAGVTILYDAWVSAPVMDGNRCRGLIIDSKSGRRFYEAGIVVDATGDADVLKAAGVPTVDGENYFTYYGEGITLEGCRRAVEKGDLWQAYYHPQGGPSNLHGGGHPEGKARYVGTDLDTVNEYLQENQLLMLENESQKSRTERNIHMLPGMCQFRTSRRLDGNATLTGEDVYQHCETSIGTICDFELRDRLYEVPYGTLIHHQYPNLITCGRSASASGWGWDVLRVIPPAILTGQAAGTAAAIALKGNGDLNNVPVPELQQKLAETGVMIHFDDSLVPAQEAEDVNAASEEHI